MTKNIIFYGPPGTGKTYSAKREAVNLVHPNQNDRKLDFNQTYENYYHDGQIQLCTFHQSLSYEEFIEGIRMDEDNIFSPVDGIFKQISLQAKEALEHHDSLYKINKDNTRFIQMSLGDLDTEEGRHIFKYGLEHNIVSTSIGAQVDLTNCDNEADIKKELTNKFNRVDEEKAASLHTFKNELQVGDIIFVSYHKDTVNAIAKVVGDYEYKNNSLEDHFAHTRKVEWLCKEDRKVSGFYKKTEFESTVLSKLDKDKLIDIEQFLYHLQPVKKYALIIDEINRGNIARIFGELISLIEPDKRLGAEHETKVSLPYSQEDFSVPHNLYIIATMNTTDRSIALMDSALRRRFTFEEVMPQPKLLKGLNFTIEGTQIRLDQLLETINQRIEFLYDREHTIGHAYFMKCKSIEDVMNVFRHNIIPLLQEYFYDDWQQIELILGGSAGNPENQDYFLYKRDVDPKDVFNKPLPIELQPKTTYSLIQNPSLKALFHIINPGDSNETSNR